MTPTSYEAHVTIEPVFGDRFKFFERLCMEYSFRPAELLLQKQRLATPARSDKDSFCTGHGKEYKELETRLMELVERLKYHDFQVWRYKIEGILLDVRETRLVQIHRLPE